MRPTVPRLRPAVHRRARPATGIALLLVSGALLAPPSRLGAQAAPPVAPRAAVRGTAAAPASAAAIDAFRARLAADVAADGIGGITAAVVVGDSVIWAQGFGWADRERRTAAGVETIYRIGSISKSFTAVALAQLVDRGTVRLDDPVDRWLPEARGFAEARPGAPPVTLRHLATHTAGIVREPRLDGAAAGPIAQWEAQVLASIPRTAFDTLPGARYSYSNIGYGVLGLALSRAAGTPFMQLVEERIFRPLGMRRTTFVVPTAWQPHLATGYANGRDGAVDRDTPAREHAGRGYKVPNGGIYSTVGDLARFVAAMSGARGDSLLRAETRRTVLTAAGPANMAPASATRGYGLGFDVQALPGGRRIAGHGGSVAGYTAYLAFDPDARVGVILLRNYNQGRTPLGEAANALVTELVRAGTGTGGH